MKHTKGNDTQNQELDSSSVADEVDLLQLTLTLFRAWKLIIGMTLLVGAAASFYAFSASDVYRAHTLLAAAKKEKTSSGSLQQFGGLAAIAGISIPGGSDTDRIIATLKSRDFLRFFITKKNLMPIFFKGSWDASKEEWKPVAEDQKPTLAKAVNLLSGVDSVTEDGKSRLITLSVSWGDPDLASEWANEMVTQLNEQLRNEAIVESQNRVGYLEQELAKTTLKDMRDVLYKLLESEKQKAMLANVKEDFALEVIDPAIPPREPFEPNRKFIIVGGLLLGGFLSLFVIFLLEFLKKLNALSKSS